MHTLGHDSLTFAGANELANSIRSYWRNRGHNVRVRVEAMNVAGDFQVRSDMIGGWPCSRK